MDDETDVEYTVIWTYEVRSVETSRFCEHYGPTGTWAQLFRRAPGFVGTQLLQDEFRKNRYVTIDRWTSRAAYESFRERFSNEYDALDERCASLTLDESFHGAFGARPVHLPGGSTGP